MSLPLEVQLSLCERAYVTKQEGHVGLLPGRGDQQEVALVAGGGSGPACSPTKSNTLKLYWEWWVKILRLRPMFS